MTPSRFIGTDLTQEIEFQDTDGVTIPSSAIDEVKIFVLVNNDLREKFTTVEPLPEGWNALTVASNIYTYTVPGEDQADWQPGLIEVEVYRKLTAGDSELVMRQEVSFAKRSASQTNAF